MSLEARPIFIVGLVAAAVVLRFCPYDNYGLVLDEARPRRKSICAAIADFLRGGAVRRGVALTNGQQYLRHCPGGRRRAEERHEVEALGRADVTVDFEQSRVAITLHARHG